MIHGSLLEKIAQQVGTPTYVYSGEEITTRLSALARGLRGLDHQICFAAKANSNLAVLRLIARTGVGIDVVSGGELFRAKHAGFAGEKIVFSGVGKTAAEIQQALKSFRGGIFCFNVESSGELELLNQVAGRLGTVARVAFRFNPDVDAKTHPYISTGLKINKFGIHRAEIVALAQRMSSFRHLRLTGISIHIGSQLLSLSPLEDAFKKTLHLLTELQTLVAEPLDHVDLGGGVGISYQGERAPSIAQYCRLIRKYFSKEAQRRHGLHTPLKILLEPGRLIIGDAGVLLTRVLFWKIRGKRRFLVIDAAMTDLIRPALYGSFHQIAPVRSLTGKKVSCDVVGPVCETGDFLARNRPMSSTLGAGDLLTIHSAGAYGFTMASNYNSRPRPAEVLVTSNTFKVVRRRESFTDLIRGESF